MIAQGAQANRGCDVKEFKLSEYLHTIAKQNNISPVPEPKQFHLLERALRTLHVSNIPLEATEEDLENLFVEVSLLFKHQLQKCQNLRKFQVEKLRWSAIRTPLVRRPILLQFPEKSPHRFSKVSHFFDLTCAGKF